MLYNQNNCGLYKVPQLWQWKSEWYIYIKKGYVMHERAVTVNV